MRVGWPSSIGAFGAFEGKARCQLWCCCFSSCAGDLFSGCFSLAGRSGLAWLACGPQLEVVNSVTGERLSAYRFSGVNEQPPTVRVVKEFSWQKRTGLLVGLEEAEGSVLCLYDLGISRVVKAVALSGRVCIFLGK